MNEAALARLGTYLDVLDLRAAILSNPCTITWLTGYAAPIGTGPSPFEGGPAIAWYRQGELTLILSDAERAAAVAHGVNVREYVGYALDEPLCALGRQADVLRGALREHGALSGAIGIELGFLPAALARVVAEELPHAAQAPLDTELPPLRAVKTEAEIDKIRRALRLCDLAQARVGQQARAGTTEMELWTSLKQATETEAGEPLPVLADVVAGRRTVDIGGPPTNYTVQPGDPILLDVVLRLDGYWGDNANTYLVDEPSTELRSMYRVVGNALQRGIDAVRPGVKASALDGLLREAIRAAGYEPYPHHSGHGLGTSYHEEPRLVPHNEMTFAPGMVIALEPGIYMPDVGGVRREHAVLVTSTGCEVLTRHMAPWRHESTESE